MERRINKRIETYVATMKSDICQKIKDANVDGSNDLVSYVFDYNRLLLDKNDFVKRKRLKNSIPVTNRCTARKANNDQCTRRRKEGCEFCGTHSKGAPHGLMDSTTIDSKLSHKLDVFGEEVGGIIYYMDKHNNVYKMEDIMSEKTNPDIIGTYELINGAYNINVNR